MTDKNGGAAFPGRPQQDPNDVNKVIHNNGMSLRDYFAAQALAGDFAAQDLQLGEITNDMSDDWMLKRAQTLYRMADAMLAARDK